MGKKGGGRAAFMRKAQKASTVEETEDDAMLREEEETEEVFVVKKTVNETPQSEDRKATENDAHSNEQRSGAEEEEEEEDRKETKGQMLQRHKREAKAVKDQVKRLGKKNKDEGARLLKAMEERHESELRVFEEGTHEKEGIVSALAASLHGTNLEEGQIKKSKAQKRREQKMKEEAEREARIAAENESRGESEREKEEKELQELLQGAGLRMRDIPPDGHCLYRSIEHQISSLTDHGQALANTVGVDPDDFHFLGLRNLCAKTLRENRDDYSAFIEGESFEAYCTEVENTAAWGGHVEIQALSRALQVHIRVFSVGMPVLDIGEEYQDLTTLNVCFLRHAYGLGEHYNSTELL